MRDMGPDGTMKSACRFTTSHRLPVSTGIAQWGSLE
jgi:hypothetical protein